MNIQCRTSVALTTILVTLTLSTLKLATFSGTIETAQEEKLKVKHRTDKEIDNATYRKLLRQAQLGTLHFHTGKCVCV